MARASVSVVVVLTFVLGGSAPAAAQTLTRIPGCDPGVVSAGVSLGRLATDESYYIPSSPGVVNVSRDRNYRSVGVTSLSGHVDIPTPAIWSMRVQGGVMQGRIPDHLDYATGHETVALASPLTLRTITVGGIRRSRVAHCAYSTVGIGLYEYAAAGQVSRNPGLYGGVGGDIPVSDRAAISFELQLHLISTHGRPPMKNYDQLGAAFTVGASWFF